VRKKALRRGREETLDQKWLEKVSERKKKKKRLYLTGGSSAKVKRKKKRNPEVAYAGGKEGGEAEIRMVTGPGEGGGGTNRKSRSER